MPSKGEPRLLDVAGAMDTLPLLPLDGWQPKVLRATGTYDLTSSPLAPTLAPDTGNQGLSVSFPVNLTATEPTADETSTLAVSCYPVNAKDSLTTGVNESLKAGEGDRTLDINLGKVALYR